MSSSSSKKKAGNTDRKRATRACDHCKKTKNKCESLSDGGPCGNCISLGVECHYSPPSGKRGPAKGYLHAVETRCHAVEALVGILLSIPDQRAVSLLSEIAEDSYARSVLDQVNNSAFGARVRKPEVDHHQDTPTQNTLADNLQVPQFGTTIGESAPEIPIGTSRREAPDPFIHGPTNAWQDTIIEKYRLSAVDQGLQPFGHLKSLASTPSSIGRNDSETTKTDPMQTEATTTTEDENYDEDDELAIGQLTLSDNSQIRFHGKSSGLNLLDQSARNNRFSEGGIRGTDKLWRLNDYHAETHVDVERLDIQLPSAELQAHFLRLYQDFIYAGFPILDLPSLWENFRKMERGELFQDSNLFKLLLLSIFALAGNQRSTDEELSHFGNPTGHVFFDQAKAILNCVYQNSHILTCQSLLLLALREYGVGASTQGWLYAGMAIRTAQHLGLHRSSDLWIRDGVNVIGESERKLRKRIWYGCLQMDKYMSMFMGRPVTIHRSTFDTPLPDATEDAEYEAWPLTPIQYGGFIFPSVPGRVMAAWNANSHLSTIACSIMERIYAVQNRKAPVTSIRSEATTLEAELESWELSLPPHLRLDSSVATNRAPPHLLTLHMQKECATIVLQLPFIQLKNLSISPQSLQSLNKAIDAATRINSLASVFYANFGLVRAIPFFSFDIFSSGTIWVAALSTDPNNTTYLQHYNQCVVWLSELKSIWPAAEQHLYLLEGKISTGYTVNQQQQRQTQQNTQSQGEQHPLSGPEFNFEQYFSSDEAFSQVFQHASGGGGISPFNWFLNSNAPSNAEGSNERNLPC